MPFLDQCCCPENWRDNPANIENPSLPGTEDQEQLSDWSPSIIFSFQQKITRHDKSKNAKKASE